MTWKLLKWYVHLAVVFYCSLTSGTLQNILPWHWRSRCWRYVSLGHSLLTQVVDVTQSVSGRWLWGLCRERMGCVACANRHENECSRICILLKSGVAESIFICFNQSFAFSLLWALISHPLPMFLQVYSASFSICIEFYLGDNMALLSLVQLSISLIIIAL